MARADKIVERGKDLMNKPEMIRNIGIVAHIDHGKTTLSDNMVAGAGMISMDLAGHDDHNLFMDFDPLEQARGITIDAANVSMVHEVDGKEYLINMIDTPGHVDFGGDVTRAMRAVDGAVVVVDAVEGAMPQTETVLRQAIREGVRPVLFINKTDRLINELKVEKKDFAMRLGKIIDNVNKLIRGMDEEKFKAGWRVDAANGTVAIGSARYNWAISMPVMKKTGIGFDQVYDYCRAGKAEELAEKVPLFRTVNDMVVHFLPSPIEAQKDRVKTIWHGDWNSEVGKAMATCDPNGPVALMITRIKVDPHAGEIATGRLFSGTLRRGLELYVSGVAATNRCGNRAARCHRWLNSLFSG
jgi:elongation factor 2